MVRMDSGGELRIEEDTDEKIRLRLRPATGGRNDVRGPAMAVLLLRCCLSMVPREMEWAAAAGMGSTSASASQAPASSGSREVCGPGSSGPQLLAAEFMIDCRYGCRPKSGTVDVERKEL